jgi:prepilin-type N-terminal cleavage/methylation domain-containing protein
VRCHRRSGPHDHGFTLVEMVVSMAIMSVVMSVVIAGIAQIYSATNRVDTASYNRSQATIAFRRLDAEMRYATWITPKPDLVGTRWYAEYAVPDGCRQLKLDTSTGVLTLASWPITSTTPANPVALASNVTVIPGFRPFQTYTIGSAPFATASTDTLAIGKGYAPQFTQLRVQVNIVTGATTTPLDSLFTAENSTTNVTSSTCSKGRPTS